MTSARFVYCDGCGRLMLGQQVAAAVHPQPHDCPETEAPAEQGVSE